MEIKYVEIKDLKPYENNPRINEAAVEAVANSIEEFGFRNPILIDADGVIIAGHTRLAAAKALGLQTVPVIVAEGLTEEQIKAFRLVDNKTAELSKWDFELLEEELAQIKGIDMEDFGFENIDTEEITFEVTEEGIEPYKYIHYLVTIDRKEEERYKSVIDRLTEMGAEVRETKNNT